MTEEPSTPVPSTSRLADVSLLTDVIASSSKVPFEQLIKQNSQDYLSNLTTYGLQELLAEPTILQTQSHHLTSSLTSLTHTSYPTFLSLHQTTNALTTSLTSLSASLDSLLTSSLPTLEESAAGWKERTEAVLKDRSKARVVLEQHEKIRDLLEIPILIDTCVRNGYFAEALSLVSHAKSLAANASASNKPHSFILSSVLSEVHHSIMQMLLSLLTTLYEPNRKLPALWKAVNFLRKMDVFGPASPFASASQQLKSTAVHTELEKSIDFLGDGISSEEQIALAFLVGRESCLKSILEPCGSDVLRMTNHGHLDDREKEDLARYLKKYIDLWREGVYDVITQYSTIFLERSTSSSTSQHGSHTNTPSEPAESNGQSLDANREWLRLQSLITTYASRALTAHLLPVLSPSLPLLSLSLLPSLLTQLTYCSNAFARVGLDFRSILSGLFSRAVVEIIGYEMKTESEQFRSRFKIPSVHGQTNTRKINGSRKPKWDQPSKWLVVSTNVSLPPVPVTPATPTAPSLSHSPPHIPPQILASYPPLAEHTNSLLGILNGLRLLAPTNILPTLTRILDDDVLSKGGQGLLQYIKAFCKEASASNLNGGHSDDGEDENDKEKRVLIAFGQVYFGVLIPFVRRALVEGVYGVKLDTTYEDVGESLPDVVMDWEDFLLEYNDGESEGSTEET